MFKLPNFINKVVEIYYKVEIGSVSEIGKFLGISYGFIYLENRIYYVEESQEHASLGNAWISLDLIKQISILDENDDIITKFFTEKKNLSGCTECGNDCEFLTSRDKYCYCLDFPKKHYCPKCIDEHMVDLSSE